MPSSCFHDLIGTPERDALERIGRTRPYTRGEHVFSEAADDGATAIITSGRCRVVSYNDDGPGAYLAVRGKGDIIGEMAAISGTPRSALVVTVTDVILQMIPRSAFRRLLATSPALTACLLGVMVERLREADRWYADLAVASPKLRFYRLLYRLVQCEGTEKPGGIELAGISHLDLAGWCGISRESVGRRIAELQQAGVLAQDRRHMRLLIPDPERLRELTRERPS